VATTNKALASAANLYFGMFSVLLPNGNISVQEALKVVLESAKVRGCYISGDIGILHGSGSSLFAEQDGVLSIVKV
jgi:pectin methylesterase-like acyl-CoA thioesterase